MKTVVLYRSESGFSRNYAEWIAEDLEADIFESRSFDGKQLTEYDCIIFGGSLHAVGIRGIKIIKNNLVRLSGKKIIVFAVGASPCRESIIPEVVNKNLTPEEKGKIQFYYFRGGFDYSKLSFFDKLLMRLMKWKIKKKPEAERTPDEKGMLAAFDHPLDFTKKENLAELIRYARGE